MAGERRRILIGLVAALVVAAAGAVAATRPQPHDLRVAAAGSPSAESALEPGDRPIVTTTSPTLGATMVLESTTTTRPPVTTTLPDDTTTTTAAPATTVAPTTTIPAGPDANHAWITVENQYAAAVTVSIGDETNNSWTLEPHATAAPWEMATSEDHGDGGSVARVDDPSCGSGDGENYFHGGHVYKLVVKTRSTNCAVGPGPELYIYDLTAGTTRTI